MGAWLLGKVWLRGVRRRNGRGGVIGCGGELDGGCLLMNGGLCCRRVLGRGCGGSCWSQSGLMRLWYLRGGLGEGVGGAVV
jgi:hypothetical protein